MRIRLDYSVSEFVLRQTPNSSGLWDDCTFVVDSDEGEFDGWVVYDSMLRSRRLVCNPARTVFITGEPPSVRTYHPRFLSQFAAVITPHRDLRHPNVILQQPAIPWWAGISIADQPSKGRASWTMGYDEFKNPPLQTKSKSISVICSKKALTDGHRMRLRFLDELIAHFGVQLDVFGHGFKPVLDKWDAIHPYKYHIVLENCRTQDYWTEKLSDTILAGAFPLYSGCPNLADYFPPGSYREIDPTNPAAAIATISEAIQNDLYASERSSMQEARELVLDRHNLVAVIARLARSLPDTPKRSVHLHPEWNFTDPWMRRIKRRIKEQFSVA